MLILALLLFAGPAQAHFIAIPQAIDLEVRESTFDVVWTLRVHPGGEADSLVARADRNGDGVLSQADLDALAGLMAERLAAQRASLVVGGAPPGAPILEARDLDVGHAITFVLRGTHARPAGPLAVRIERKTGSVARFVAVSVRDVAPTSSKAAGDATALAHTADRTWSGSLAGEGSSISFVLPAAGSIEPHEDRP